MQSTTRRPAVLLLVLIMCMAMLGATNGEAQTRKRSGVFKVAGLLVHEGGEPVVDARVMIAPLVAGDKPGVFKSEVTFVGMKDGRLRAGAGDGRTDKKGRFEIVVEREGFNGPKILFSVLVATTPAAKMQEVTSTATGQPIGFEIAERNAAIEVGKIVFK